MRRSADWRYRVPPRRLIDESFPACLLRASFPIREAGEGCSDSQGCPDSTTMAYGTKEGRNASTRSRDDELAADVKVTGEQFQSASAWIWSNPHGDTEAEGAPTCKSSSVLLGSHPSETTCGMDPEVGDDVAVSEDMDDLEAGFPRLKQLVGAHHPHLPSYVAPSPPTPPPKPRFKNLLRFLGYFRSSTSSKPQPHRTYTQAVRSKSDPAMVYPIRNRGGGREGSVPGTMKKEVAELGEECMCGSAPKSPRRREILTAATGATTIPLSKASNKMRPEGHKSGLTNNVQMRLGT